MSTAIGSGAGTAPHAANRARSNAERPNTGPGLALAVADVSWPNTENLFREIDHGSVDVLLMKCQDYLNGWRRGVFPWSRACGLRRAGARRWERQFVLPSGWMKRFPRLGMRPVARGVRSWERGLAAGRRRALVMSYPYYIHLREMLKPDTSIYYNIDDYSLYWPARAEEVRSLELEIVRASDLTLCVSRLRVEELRAAVPEAAGRIQHAPHGAPSRFLAPAPLARPAAAPADIAALPRPILGYIGSLEDRVDWELMDRVSRAFPGASIVVVGRDGGPVDQPWWEAAARFLGRPNVHAIGWRRQDDLPLYYHTFNVCLIPYQIDHPFNRACNPTKIMDAMGSGRPIVATALPECRLHAERFDVAEDADEFLSAIARLLLQDCDDGRAETRHSYALANTCRAMGERILNLIAPDGL